MRVYCFGGLWLVVFFMVEADLRAGAFLTVSFFFTTVALRLVAFSADLIGLAGSTTIVFLGAGAGAVAALDLTGDWAIFLGVGYLAADLLRLARGVLAGGIVFDFTGDLLALDFAG